MQFIQEVQNAICSSDRFSTKLADAFIFPDYIYTIRNPDIRLLCTRTDFSVLSTCRASKKQSRMFQKCNTDSETILYIVSPCPYFSVEINNFYDLY